MLPPTTARQSRGYTSHYRPANGMLQSTRARSSRSPSKGRGGEGGGPSADDGEDEGFSPSSSYEPRVRVAPSDSYVGQYEEPSPVRSRSHLTRMRLASSEPDDEDHQIGHSLHFSEEEDAEQPRRRVGRLFSRPNEEQRRRGFSFVAGQQHAGGGVGHGHAPSTTRYPHSRSISPPKPGLRPPPHYHPIPPQHRRAPSPPPPSAPRLLTTSSSPSTRFFGYQLALPHTKLVPLLIGKGGERASKIREEAGLVELTFGFRASCHLPIARLLGSCEALQEGVEGILECLRVHGREERGEMGGEWCRWEAEEVWSMGVTTEEYWELKMSGHSAVELRLEKHHPFAEGLLTRLPTVVRRAGFAGATRGVKGGGKRRSEGFVKERPRKVSRSEPRGDIHLANEHHQQPYSRQYEAATRGRRLPQQVRPPQPHRRPTPEPMRSHSRPPPSLSPSPTNTSSAPSPLASSASRETLATSISISASDYPPLHSSPAPPQSIEDDPQRALLLLRSLAPERRAEIFGFDPLRSVPELTAPSAMVDVAPFRPGRLVEATVEPELEFEYQADEEMLDYGGSPLYFPRLEEELGQVERGEEELEEGEIVSGSASSDESSTYP